MTKEELLEKFDGSKPKLAGFLGVSRQTIYSWPSGELPEYVQRRVLAVYTRKRLPVPSAWRDARAA